MSSICVVYAPFQIADVGGFHASLIEKAFAEHDQVMIALPVRRVSPSKKSPLSFEERRILIQEYLDRSVKRKCEIVAVIEAKYRSDMVRSLETAIKLPLESVVVLSDPEMIKFLPEKMPRSFIPRNFLVEEEELRESVSRAYPNSDYRLGVIRGLNSLFPISWATVDVAIRRVDRGMVDGRQTPPKVLYLVGRKPGEVGWRFIGGFKNRSDANFEAAVLREGGEEALKPGVDPKKVFSAPKYICSRNVNDWRYAGEVDGITTAFYIVNFVGTLDQIKAGDDIAETAWRELSELDPSHMEGEHSFLLGELHAYAGSSRDS